MELRVIPTLNVGSPVDLATETDSTIETHCKLLMCQIQLMPTNLRRFQTFRLIQEREVSNQFCLTALLLNENAKIHSNTDPILQLSVVFLSQGAETTIVVVFCLACSGRNFHRLVTRLRGDIIWSIRRNRNLKNEKMINFIANHLCKRYDVIDVNIHYHASEIENII